MIMLMTHITGIVVPGKQRSRLLGTPTANIEYDSTQPPGLGVWSCLATDGKASYKAIACVGMWTLQNQLPSCEVHLLNFSGDLYGSEIAVVFRTKLRDLQTFESIEDLKRQIAIDIEHAKQSLT